MGGEVDNGWAPPGLLELEAKATETASSTWGWRISGACDGTERTKVLALAFRSAIDNFAMNGDDRRDRCEEEDEIGEVI